ncbi:MAG: purine-binding chemotaxis protein CheW [Firmicutes bacterium]|nr:purine-binding chemotaxis protein CheW [Bacillota bacterium]
MALDNEQIETGIDNKPAEEDTTKDKYLTFLIDNEEYGIDICYVIEIIPVAAITWVPETPQFLKGIINLRGSIIPVIDVRLRFHKEEKAYDELTCIIVIEYEDYMVGLLVDTVNEVMLIPEENISMPPNAKLKYQNKFIKNIGKMEDEVQLLLDLNKFLMSE